MALTKYTTDMAIIQKLDDEPNDSGGLSPAQLKSKFDEGGEAIKTFLNNTLSPEVDAALGEKVDKTTTVNGHALGGNVEVTKGDVGLGNADNTSDMSKPVSTAQAAALALKANKENVLEKDNTTPYTPTQGNHPATKKYVDETTAAVVMGTLPDKSVTQQKLSFLPAEIDPVTNKVKKNQMPTDMFLPVAGGTLTGPLTLPADPSEPLHAVPKQYADAVGRNAMAIRKTLPVAAGQTIAAGDVVNVVSIDETLVTFIPPTYKEEITKSSSSSQAIALQPGTAGQSIDIIYSGVAELPGITAGTEITSPGVYGYCPTDGWVDVSPEWRPDTSETGTYVGTGAFGAANPTVITLKGKPKSIFIFGKFVTYQPSDYYYNKWVQLCPYGSIMATSARQSNYNGTSVSSGIITAVFSDRQVSFYAETAQDQMNGAGAVYNYVAIF